MKTQVNNEILTDKKGIFCVTSHLIFSRIKEIRYLQYFTFLKSEYENISGYLQAPGKRRITMCKSNKITVLNHLKKPKKKILFLGYDSSQTRIIKALIDAKCEVHHTKDPINKVDYDLIFSFGYRHLINKKTIDGAGCPILNLHISYLPYNKGAHPNFWSFYENTPSGVTIHIVDEGIDTGPIVYQKCVIFDSKVTTFSESHQLLMHEIENLFITNLDNLIYNRWEAKPQPEGGSLHYIKDLPDNFHGWDSNIVRELNHLYKISEAKV